MKIHEKIYLYIKTMFKHGRLDYLTFGGFKSQLIDFQYSCQTRKYQVSDKDITKIISIIYIYSLSNK